MRNQSDDDLAASAFQLPALKELSDVFDVSQPRQFVNDGTIRFLDQSTDDHALVISEQHRCFDFASIFFGQQRVRVDLTIADLGLHPQHDLIVSADRRRHIQDHPRVEKLNVLNGRSLGHRGHRETELLSDLNTRILAVDDHDAWRGECFRIRGGFDEVDQGVDAASVDLRERSTGLNLTRSDPPDRMNPRSGRRRQCLAD